MNSNVGERIKSARQQWGLTQEEVAQKAGISRIALGNYERGERTPPIDIFARIANALHVSMDDLYGFNKPTKWEQLKKEFNTHGFYITHSKIHKGYVIVLETGNAPSRGATPLKDVPTEIQNVVREYLEERKKEYDELKVKDPWPDQFEILVGRWFYIANEDTLYNLMINAINSVYFIESVSKLYLDTLMNYSHRQLSKIQKAASDSSKSELWDKILSEK